MIERAYTVREIDELRIAVDNHCRPKIPPGQTSIMYYPTPAKEIEDRVRTYMLAGKTAADFNGDERDFRGSIT